MARREATGPEFYSGKTLYPIIGVLIALSALFGLVIMPRLAPAGAKLVAKPAPDFTLPVLANGDAGARMQLSHLRDKIVILDFWATWCGPCEMQAPILDRVARRHQDRVVVLGINVGEGPELVKAYVKKKGLSYPILADAEGDTQTEYGASSLPTIVIIDPQGNIVNVQQGVVREAQLERQIEDLRDG